MMTEDQIATEIDVARALKAAIDADPTDVDLQRKRAALEQRVHANANPGSGGWQALAGIVASMKA